MGALLGSVANAAWMPRGLLMRSCCGRCPASAVRRRSWRASFSPVRLVHAPGSATALSSPGGSGERL
eukprot:5300276-Pyramimonas_sp.AAC.1